MKTTVILAGVFALAAGAANAETRYLAAGGDDAADGRTPATAWRTIEKANAALPGGATLRLRSGDVFYGGLKLPSGPDAAHPTVLTSWGEGPKPVISATKNLKPDPSAWQDRSHCFWRINLANPSNFTGLVTDDCNPGFLLVDGEVKPWKRFCRGDLVSPWDFCGEDGWLYVHADENPATLAKDIRVALRVHCVQFGSHAVISNVAVRATGAHGMHGGWGCDLEHVRISDCEFENIGGSELTGFSPQMRVRYGNGIELGGDAADVVVERCSFRGVYDVCFTMQGFPKKGWRDVHCRACTMTDCTQAFEIWCKQAPKGVGFTRCSFTGNRTLRVGGGWGELTRPCRRVATPLLIYMLETDTVDIDVRGNVFEEAPHGLIYCRGGRENLPAGYRIEDNDLLPRASGDIDVVAVYYPHWHKYPKGTEWFGEAWDEGEWAFVKTAVPRYPGHRVPMVPLTGYLNGRDPKDVATEIALASNAGIDVFLYDYYYYGGKVTQEEAIEEGFLKAENRRLMKFALMWCYHDRRDQFRPPVDRKERRLLMKLDRTPEEFLGLIDLSIARYFGRPEYWRKDGKLFFSIFGGWDFIPSLGKDAAARALKEARRRVAAAGLGEIHFNVQGLRPDQHGLAREVGFDSLTDYNVVPQPGPDSLMSYEDQMKASRERWAQHAKGALPYMPVVTTGWDCSARCALDAKRPWHAAGYPYVGIVTNSTPEKFERLLRDAKAYVENDPKGVNAVYINAWNEYTECPGLLPTVQDGDAWLRAVKRVFKGTALTGAVSVDVTRPGRVLPNTSQVLTVWNGVSADWSVPDNRDYPTRDFVEYVEMMSCTGGNAERDLFRNPADRSVLDDYDFTRLVTACRGILAHGAKPYLKLGNVPVKFTADYDGGEFSMNIRPPADHLVHYRYMRACAAALKAAFGRDEVRTWRFAVLTEADNIGWFRAKSKDKAEIREEYFMLYDYAAQAFEEELGGGLVFGSHLLYPGDAKISQFSVEDFVAHCARGTNAATHRVGAPLRLLTVSYYGRPDGDDASQGRCTEIRRVSEAVARAGFTNVVMGVDEGRVITATRGRNGRDLAARAVGQSYEAAFDVRVMREIVDAGQDYFATWGYFSGPDIRFAGVPSHHYFTSRELALFKGLRRLPASVSGPLPPKEELDAVAGVSVDGRTVRAVVGRFRDRLVFTNRLETAVAFRLPKAWAGRGVRVSVLTLDDRNNWFGDWQRDRIRHGIADNDFNWSPDSFSVMSGKGLREEAKRKVFESLQGAYSAKAASVRPNVRNLTVTADGLLTVPINFAGNGASFISFLH